MITGDIAIMLGFEKDTMIEKETLSPFVADVNGGFSSMYVYTDRPVSSASSQDCQYSGKL